MVENENCKFNINNECHAMACYDGRECSCKTGKGIVYYVETIKPSDVPSEKETITFDFNELNDFLSGYLDEDDYHSFQMQLKKDGIYKHCYIFKTKTQEDILELKALKESGDVDE
jgi:hypothetical protein